MKKAILTIVNGDKYNEIWKRVEPYFIAYAEKCDAELIVMSKGEVPTAHWLKFGIYDLLHKQFDRIAFIDADILIRPDTPSLFDIVPEDSFGIFNEGYYTPRSVCIHEVKKVYKVDLPNWNGKDYFNTGVMVVSRCHRHIFKIMGDIKQLRNAFGEQTYLNMRIMQSGVKIHHLDFSFNRMSIMDRITGMTRLDSFLVHYAGFDVLFGEGALIKALDRDIERWKQDGPEYKYKRKIFIWSFGGMGDVICAEPVLRYIKEVAYTDADIYVMTRNPELYAHIKDIWLGDKYPDGDFDAIYEMNTHFIEHGQFHAIVPHSLAHPVDWISMAIMGRQLTNEQKQIHLQYGEEDLAEVKKIYDKPEELVIIHPGRGWETKPQPLTSLIKTPSGWVKMGDIKVGTIVCTPDGGTSKVDGVYPKGKQKTFEIVFADGRRTRCTSDHLWKVYHENWSRNWKKEKIDDTWKIKSLSEIIDHPSSRPFYIPLPNPVYGEVANLPIDPYVLGCLLGDGCFSENQSIQFTTNDTEILQNIESRLTDGISLKQNTGSKIDFRITGLMGNKGDTYIKKLKKLELWGKLSHNKFIPNIYKNSSVEQRLELVQGLMDTDGNAAFKNGHAVNFYTVSNQLALDMQYLIRSLGGLCTITSKERIKNGLKTARLFTCHIRDDNPERFFKLTRKREHAVRCDKNITRKCRIMDIIPMGLEEVQCISINHPDHLYITDDFIVTHNTFPKAWWEEVIKGIRAAGMKVGLIGKEVSEQHGYVPVDCEVDVDFRDKISVKGMIALIAQAPLLITNDSVPVHIAGAFDNKIILLPSCKHPDRILPYRNGTQYHKAKALWKKILDDDHIVTPTSMIGWKMAGWQIGSFKPGHTIEEYIPEPKQVIEEAFNFLCE